MSKITLATIYKPAKADVKAVPSASTIKLKRKRAAGRFYLTPESWFERAATAVESKQQLAIAVRLYRCWRMRPRGEDNVVASNIVLIGQGGSGTTREIKRRTIKNLQQAGLLQVVEEGRRGRSPRVRIVE
jgi:hypothetical protein